MFKTSTNQLKKSFSLFLALIVAGYSFAGTVDGGNLTTDTGLTEMDICAGDDISDAFNITLTDTIAPSSAWVITDTLGIILAVPSGPPFDLDGAGPGVCQIWHISFEGPLNGLNVNGNVANMTGCFDLSNAITINRSAVDGGNISFVGGETATEICAGDGVPDPIDVVYTNTPLGETTEWIVTNPAGEIIDLPVSATFDFESFGEGVSLIRGISYNGIIVNLQVGNDISTLQGCFGLTNPISVKRNAVNGGNLTTSSGATQLAICANDGQSDAFNVILTENTGEAGDWVVTDENGMILEIPVDPPFDFEGTGTGTCQIWFVAFFDTLMNLTVGNNVSQIEGCFDFSNPITISRDGADAGSITFVGGSTVTDVCTGDGNPDLVDVELDAMLGGINRWVITDANNTILELPAGPPFDFENAGAGQCLIYYISHCAGVAGINVGNNISDITGMFEISNSLTVNRIAVAAGALEILGGGTSTAICAGDGIPDAFDVSLTGNIATNSAWVITDANGNILDLPANPPFDLDGAGAGTCLIWHLGYEDGLTGLNVGANVAMLDGCYVFSNEITVVRDDPTAGQIQFTGGGTQENICAGDGTDDPLDVDLTGNVGTNSAWVITAPDSTILALPVGPPFNLEGAGAGTCYIYHISYGNLTGLSMGANLQDLTGCFEISNGVSVVREGVNGGTLSLLDFNDEIFLCTNDGMSDAFDVMLSDNSGDNFSWVITDANGNILDLPLAPPFDLEGAGPGQCFIYNLSYANGLTGLVVGNNVSDLVGCYDFSDEITAFREAPEGGDLALAGGGTILNICAGDGISDAFTPVISNNVGGSTDWIITDAVGIILDIPSAPPFDLEGTGSGQCLLYHISFGISLSGLTVGADINNITGCFALSNAIVVERSAVDGGSLETSTGLTELEICANDGISDAFDVTLTGNSGSNSGWLITDANGNILDLSATPPFDLEGAGQGVCSVYNISYDSGLTGLAVGNNTNDLVGCFALSNPINVIRTSPIGGTLELPDGSMVIDICAGDGTADLINPVLSNNTGTESAYIITDAAGIILDLPSAPPFDLEGAGGGQCLIWHLSYGGTIGGLTIGGDANALTGCFELSNAITVNRNGVAGGELSLLDGNTSMSICANDGISNQFNVNLLGTEGDSSAWVITNANGDILGLPSSPPFDLEGAGQGTCLIWHLSYSTGLTGLMIGNNVSTLTGCYDFSNSITVERDAPEGGQLMLMGGGTVLDICAGDGIADEITPLIQNNIGANSEWIITDANGTILELPPSPPFDLEGAGGGQCLIWNISYGGTITGLTVGENTNDIVGCFALSTPITVNRDGVNGGTLQTVSGLTELVICAGDGISDAFNVSQTDTVGANMTWVITDANGNILDLPAAPPFDLEGAGQGTCLVWNLAYADGLTGLMVGNNTSVLSGCFSLSNPIEVVRSSSTASTIAISGNGGTSTSICSGDGISDAFDVDVIDGAGDNQGWIITDANLMILALPAAPPFDLEGAGGGQCLIWRIDYSNGLVGLAVGENVGDFMGCFALSNPITVDRSEVVGGSLETEDGQNEISICVGDGISDAFNVNLTGSVGDSSAWVITDANGTILDLPAVPPFDLEGAGPGQCLIWNVAHNGLNGLTVGQNVSGFSGCYALSNSIIVNRTENVGGEIVIPGSGFDIDICAGDGISDAFDVTLNGNAGQNSGWVITNQNGEILGLPAAPPFDLEGAGGGVCLIWHISYTDGLTGLAVGDNVNLLVGCHALSNSIRVNRDGVTPGVLSLIDQTDSLTICAGDGVADPFDVMLSGSTGANSSWVITNETGEILGIPAGPPFDLEGAGGGVCFVWNIAHGDDLTGLTVGANTSGLAGCYVLSNPITVTRITEGSLCITSTDNLTDHTAFEVSPNPTNGLININVNRIFRGKVEIRIIDVSGKILALEESNQSLINLNIDTYPAGVYFVEISNEDFSGTQRIIKQ